MEHSSLKDHTFKKGVFITPMNDAIGDKLNFNNWFLERAPEYLWLGLLLDGFDDRKMGLQRIAAILKYICDLKTSLISPLFSEILALDEKIQTSIYSCIQSNGTPKSLSPLTLLFPYSKAPIFASAFIDDEMNAKCKYEKLINVLKKMADHQSEFSTDIRFCVVYFSIASSHLCVKKNVIDELNIYAQIDHSDERMRSIRPLVRSLEITPAAYSLNNQQCITEFWRRISSMSECKPFAIEYTKDVEDDSVSSYNSFLKAIFEYFSNLYRITNPLDKKMLVLLGLATYSYKLFSEITDHALYNSVSGRTVIRIMIEDFIMMKYLLKMEPEKPDIWIAYQSYGIGQLKLIVERYLQMAEKPDKSHVDYKYLDIVVGSYGNKEFLNMDTTYFDKKSIRDKAIFVNEKSLFDDYYDYDSSFEHGLWGAIRESALLACDAPGHQYHCVPDFMNAQHLKSVWYDAVMVMNKTIRVLEENFGLSDELKGRMKEYE